MELTQAMALFVQIAQDQGLRRAARSMGLSPATASAGLSQLERRLAAKLVVRGGRTLDLTPEGQIYLAHCQRVLSDIAQTQQRLTQARGDVEGRVRINAPATLVHHLLLPIWPDFVAKYPRVELELHYSGMSFAASAMPDDLMLRLGPFNDSSLVALPLGQANMVTLASPQYLACAAIPKHPQELTQHRCINILIPDTGRCHPWEFARRGETPFKIEVNGPILFDGGEGRVQAALLGLGIAQALEFQAAEHIRSGRLVSLLDEWESSRLHIHVLVRRELKDIPRVRAVLNHLIEHYPPDRAIHGPAS